MNIDQNPGFEKVIQANVLTNYINRVLFRPLVRFCSTKPLGAAGLIIVVIFVIISLTSKFIVPYEASEIVQHTPYGEISFKHWLGTDELGRDIFSRLIEGAKVSLFVGFFAPGIGITVGAMLGIISGYFGGKTDLLGQRLVDIMMAIPGLLLALVILSMIGFTMWNLIFAASVLYLVVSVRTLRASTLGLKERPFVDAARAIGATNLRILVRHIAPNCAAPYIVLFAIYFGQAVLLEATLSFLGVGIQPPTPSWGNMLTSAQSYVRSSPQAAIAPGLCLSVVVLGINLLGDSLRDVLDPRLRGSS